ncbi:hypothetical protein HanXRQr2_Chr02g0076701 [Helianthus annuus]|uniref:Uncharacterized protein n=1 Tax=Helianthus annuus TaxID=4232 RepID=A0A9K3JPI4_HELAN|nr:hypothetical protein HanXRQr2_Chr02g0076701 [Helianthus annuus]KAJ0952617.1 hypothetical protein HanPSC8_Chr02g0074391 [Helianthus annuus]
MVIPKIVMCVVFCPNRLTMMKNNQNNWIRKQHKSPTHGATGI